MRNWREKIWLKIIALTIAGVFLFSEVTWAARANLSFGVLPVEQFNASHSSQGNLGDILLQIYQEVTLFLLPTAHAEEVSPYKNEDKRVLPVLNPNSHWKKPCDMINVPAESAENENEQGQAQDESGEKQPEGEIQGAGNTKATAQQEEKPANNHALDLGGGRPPEKPANNAVTDTYGGGPKAPEEKPANNHALDLGGGRPPEKPANNAVTDTYGGGPDVTAQQEQKAIEPVQIKEEEKTQSGENQAVINNEPIESESPQTQPNTTTQQGKEPAQDELGAGGPSVTAQQEQNAIEPAQIKEEEKTESGENQVVINNEPIESESPQTQPSVTAQQEQKAIEPVQIKELKGVAEVQITLPREDKIAQEEDAQVVQVDVPVLSKQDKETAESEVQEPSHLEAIQVPQSVVVNEEKADFAVQETNNATEQKEEINASINAPVQEAKEPIRLKGSAQPCKQDAASAYMSGLKFLIPPLENVVIPLVTNQTNNDPNSENNTRYSNPTLITEKGNLGDIRGSYFVEDVSSRIDAIYASAPPTGPPLNTSDNTAPITKNLSQGSGNSAASPPVEPSGLIVSSDQNEITPTQETQLPRTEAISVLHNHGPPL